MDAFDHQRFLDAQERGGSHASALAELRAGRKRTHWVWWVFPQLRGLGRSARSWEFGIDGAAEARAHLAHPVLGERVRAAARALLDQPRRDPVAVLGEVDAVKVRSSVTLFAEVSGEEVFTAVLAELYGGQRDPATLDLLR